MLEVEYFTTRVFNPKSEGETLRDDEPNHNRNFPHFWQLVVDAVLMIIGFSHSHTAKPIIRHFALGNHIGT